MSKGRWEVSGGSFGVCWPDLQVPAQETVSGCKSERGGGEMEETILNGPGTLIFSRADKRCAGQWLFVVVVLVNAGMSLRTLWSECHL